MGRHSVSDAKRYSVTGMSCAACSARVEKAVSEVSGVTGCTVSLLTNSMTVAGGQPDDVIGAVEKAGYGASLMDKRVLEDTESPRIAKRLITSAAFLLLLMYLSMGNLMFGLPVPEFLDSAAANASAQLILAAVIMVINRKFFINGAKGLVHLAPNMDTLVALGSAASFIYSTAVLIELVSPKGQMNPNSGAYVTDLYFESAAMILVLISVGKLLEAKAKGRTTDALRSLMKLAPKEATLIIEGKETSVPIDEVKAGDLFVVRPGENIPVDGVVTEGASDVIEASLTGESMPVGKTVGSYVYASTTNATGYMVCRASKVGEDTTLAQIIRMVSDASATKAPIARLADKVSGVFVPIVMGIAALTFIIWFVISKDPGYSLARGISVLVVSCPCSLGLATPVAIMVANGVGAKHGILFKNAEILELVGKTRIAALDKTGTITTGIPEVTDIIPYGDLTHDDLLNTAASLEAHSEHPIAKAILKKSEPKFAALELTAVPGRGVSAVINGEGIYGGSEDFIRQFIKLPDGVSEKAFSLYSSGKTAVHFASADRYLGLIAVADVQRDDSHEAVASLRALGLRTVMISGDNALPAGNIGKAAGVDAVIAGVLPDGKNRAVQSLKTLGTTAMIGDGINDAPALAAADIGVAIGSGTDVAIDAAGIVLMNSSLKDLVRAIRLSRKTLSIIRGNLFWAFFYNVIGIPIAAGVFIPLFGFGLSPIICAAMMSLSSIFVVTNALRINRFDLDSDEDEVRRQKKLDKMKTEYSRHPGRKYNEYPTSLEDETDISLLQEVCEQYGGQKTMTKTITVKGMMCTHCSGRVKKVLEAIEGITSAEVSHETGLAVVTLTHDVADDILKKTIEDEGYEVTEITA